MEKFTNKKLASLVIFITMIFVTACSKKTDNYVGYWQKTNGNSITEIKKDGSNYILVNKIFANGINGTPLETLPLTEKEGKLIANIGLGDIPLTLSDDNKTLYVVTDTYTKIDEAKKNETIEKAKKSKELQAKCNVLNKEYRKKIMQLTISMEKGVNEARQDALNQEYLAKYKEVEKDGQCQIKPNGIIQAQAKK